MAEEIAHRADSAARVSRRGEFIVSPNAVSAMGWMGVVIVHVAAMRGCGSGVRGSPRRASG